MVTFWERVRPCFLFVLFLYVIIVISRFGFEGRIWILIAPVPGLCLLFTSNVI